MTHRERWQALQARLSAAQALIEAGDRRKALAEVNAALALDPDFLAAQALRDGLLKTSGIAVAPPPLPARSGAPAAAPTLLSGSAPATTLPAGTAQPVAPLVKDRPAYDFDRFRVTIPVAPPPSIKQPPAVSPAPSVQPLVSTEGYAHFEARARRRRVDRRIEAARAALARRKLHEAASVLDEIISLDPNLPELARLTAEFDELRKAIATPRRGPWLTAAAVFVVVVLGASYLHESTILPSYPVKAEVSLVVPPRLSLLPPATVVEPSAVGTGGATDTVADAVDRREPAPAATERVMRPAALSAVLRDRPAAEPDRIVPALPPAQPAATPVNEPPQSVAVSLPAVSPLATPAPAAPPRAAPTAAATAILPSPASAPTPTLPPADDEGQVKQTLQRYRRAYEGLDARSAHAVWPAVNQAALARAFDGLASQAITFDNCDVQVRGAVASATCRGTARYVPKIGSREPRVEPRVWSFALRKDGGDWKIDSARTDR